MRLSPAAFHKSLSAAAVAVFGLLAALPAGAQALTHRYSFNGTAADSVGGASGTVIGGVTLAAMPGVVNGAAVFAGGTSNADPGYISLPPSSMNTLQNATVEIFTTNFTVPNNSYGTPGGKYQALLSVASPLGNTTNYLILSANRDYPDVNSKDKNGNITISGNQIGTGARTDNGPETRVLAQDPLPYGYGYHVVALVFSGFGGVGSTGTETIYVDGKLAAQGPTVYSFAKIASGSGGAPIVGLGGGSPFNDPTFQGSMNEVRVYNDALTAAQVGAEFATGPADFGYVPGLQLTASAVSSVTTSTATVGWTSSNAASTTVSYGTGTAYGATATGAATVFTHTVNLTGLTPGTTYHYQVTSKDIYGQTQTGADSTFTTVAPALTLSTPNALPVSDTSATLNWTSSNAADTSVNYGPTASYGSTATGAAGVTAHTLALSGLTPGVTYHYMVTSKDAYGQTVSSPDATFTTAAQGSPRIALRSVLLTRDSSTGDLIAAVVLTNGGTGDALSTNITAVSLNGVATTTALPVTIPFWSRNVTTSLTFRFAGQPSGGRVAFRIAGKSSAVSFSGSGSVTFP